ncbi:protein-export chaperone SecB [Candidatus Puniceispirillum sp.]|nr:protein-export chaperone SecB [Candidatus Puniceispirillum sp.]
MAAKKKHPETQTTKHSSNKNGPTSNSNSDNQIIVHTQYIKDLSFENPNAPHILIEGPSQPDVEIAVNVGAELINKDQYEVTLKIAAKAIAGETTLFLVDLTYAGLVTPEGATADEVNPLIMIEAPRLLFPFARAIISEATRDGGFMPLNIQPVDFIAVYQHNIAQKISAKTNN